MENRRLRRLVMDLLQRGLSPEQIAGRLRAERGETVVSAETIGEGLDSSEAGEVLAVGESSKRIPRCARDDTWASCPG
jgi:IS30 family transposase